MEDTWAIPREPHPLASDFARQGAVTGPGSEPPEIAVMSAQGWHFLDPASVGAMAFAAVWEPRARTWLPDRRVPTWEVHHGDGRVEQREATAQEITEIDRDLANALAQKSLPAPPGGRLWFVRLPAPWHILDDYVEALYARVDAEGLDDRFAPAWEFVRAQIARDFGTR